MEDDQQFCLRWNNHQSTLISVFDTLLENGTLVDCTLAAEGKFLKAHKVVLSACSPYFATLLTQQYDKHPVFILKDVKFQELRAMMDYMYRGEVNISQDQLAALLRAAESLQIKGLSDNRGGSGSSGGGGVGGSGGGDSGSKNENAQQKPIPVPVVSKPGLTIEQKRPNKHPAVIDAELCESREGSTSPTSRKRKKIRRRSTETNNLVDNHDQLSNSSSQSMPHHQPQQQTQQQQNKHVSTSSSSSTVVASLPQITSATSAANVLNVTKKTDIHEPKKELLDQSMQKELIDDEEDDDDDDENEIQEPPIRRLKSQQQHHDIDIPHLKEKLDSTHSELLIEPKSEYDDVNDETVEDLTLDEEELLEDLDQAGPSHGGEGSSQGYAQWQVDRSQDEVFLAAQEAAGQHRDAQDTNNITERLKSFGPEISFFQVPKKVKNKCGKCGKSFKKAWAYRFHVRMECGKDLACKRCNRKYTKYASLMWHENYVKCTKDAQLKIPKKMQKLMMENQDGATSLISDRRSTRSTSVKSETASSKQSPPSPPLSPTPQSSGIRKLSGKSINSQMAKSIEQKNCELKINTKHGHTSFIDETLASPSDDKFHFCDRCSSYFRSYKYFIYHQKYECGRDWSCKKCHHKFGTRQGLYCHKKKGCQSTSVGIDDDDDPDEIECVTVKSETQNSEDDSDIASIHICTCGMIFTRKVDVEMHKKWECGKELKCSKCLEIFPSKIVLDEHQQKCFGVLKRNLSNGGEQTNIGMKGKKNIEPKDNQFDEIEFVGSSSADMKSQTAKQMTEETNEKKLCTRCKGRFAKLQFHKKYICNQNMTCKGCRNQFSSTNSLMKHIKYKRCTVLHNHKRTRKKKTIEQSLSPNNDVSNMERKNHPKSKKPQQHSNENEIMFEHSMTGDYYADDDDIQNEYPSFTDRIHNDNNNPEMILVHIKTEAPDYISDENNDENFIENPPFAYKEEWKVEHDADDDDNDDDDDDDDTNNAQDETNNYLMDFSLEPTVKIEEIDDFDVTDTTQAGYSSDMKHPFKQKCPQPQCPFEYWRDRDLTYHQRVECCKTMECPRCNKQFTLIRSYRRHLKTVCNGIAGTDNADDNNDGDYDNNVIIDNLSDSSSVTMVEMIAENNDEQGNELLAENPIALSDGENENIK